MAMKNDAIFEEEFTCRLEIDTTIWRVLTQAFKCLKNLHFNYFLLIKVYNIWPKNYRGIMSDEKFEGKLICAFKEFGKFSLAEK